MKVKVNGYLEYDIPSDGIDYSTLHKFNLYEECDNDVEDKMNGWNYDEIFTDYENINLPPEELEKVCDYIIEQYLEMNIYIEKARVETFSYFDGTLNMDMVYYLSITWKEAYEKVFCKEPKEPKGDLI